MQREIKVFFILCIMFLSLQVSAQKRFFNLSSADVKIDTMLPHFTCSFDLGIHYADSVYTVSILYPEFINMTSADIAHYQRLSRAILPTLPTPNKSISVSRKVGLLQVDFCPLVYRNHRYQKLVSFMLQVKAQPLRNIATRSAISTRVESTDRYAAHSVLSKGSWAKIRVPATGVYQLTNKLIRKAGFTDLKKIKVYGYGGRLQNEKLLQQELIETDDLKEVPTCWVNGKRLFYAYGSVSWTSKTTPKRTRNPYSDYGYYFITQTNDEPKTTDIKKFIASFYPSNDFYHSLYEVDGYAWFYGGRNLFHPEAIEVGKSATYIIPSVKRFCRGKVSVNVSAGAAAQVKVLHNGKEIGDVSISLDEHDMGSESDLTCRIQHIGQADTITLTDVSGSPVRLDYISFAWEEPLPAPQLKDVAFPEPEYVYNITHQDLHGDGFADMVIIIPTTQKWRNQAERLKAFHEQHDKLRVHIVPADELYNEFSSGTPDANAYRRYLKMLYDRAKSKDDIPKYLLLFGDGVWDNRMLTSECRQLNADDYLLCYESENSFSKVYSYVDDGFFCALDDGEGPNENFSDLQDVAVGRFPVTTEAQAKAVVDKVITYVTNKNAGAWQNTLVFMGDDGDNNLHMKSINKAADDIAKLYPGYLIKKIMWDAFVRETSFTGNTYPTVSQLIKQQQAEGALIMNYGGHGMATQLSHERVLNLRDFELFRNTNLPLWITASCDIMPFDGVSPTIGETAILNPNGGALAFLGTTRTVIALYNAYLNTSFLRHVLSKDAQGKPITIGEAQRLAKNEMITREKDLTCNKLNYTLLGDPAVALHQPTYSIVVDSINDVSLASKANAFLTPGSIAKIVGHIANAPQFEGIVTATVRDNKEEIICRRNDYLETKDIFRFFDYPKTLYSGSNQVKKGMFTLRFAVPLDINYSNATGLLNIYAVSNNHQFSAQGMSNAFTLGGSAEIANDFIGPSIYCYLNTPSFVNGGNVNSTPYFVAKVSDENGINVSGRGIGHDLQLTIDGDMSKTYSLNPHFTYDFGSYTSGSTYYQLPELSSGFHKLQFRAWDILNNSSTTELTFNVVKGMQPQLFSIGCTQNPARTFTTFIINHDRIGALLDVEIEVMDMTGRILWQHKERGISEGNTYTIPWNLCTNGAQRLQTGVYLYRVRIASGKSSFVSKAQKLIILGN